MKKSFVYNSYRHHYESIMDVIHEMEDLDKELLQTDLENLLAFNHTYLIITKAVASKLGQKYFNNDELMQTLDINFAGYYFLALKDYVEGKSTPPAWALLFDACKKNNLLQSIYMGMGVNAHVNNDLSQSLRDVIQDTSYKEDFDKVNTIIHYSTPEVIKYLKEENTVVNTVKNISLPIYSFALSITIQKWRENAWNDSRKLIAHTISEEKIENQAYTMAKKLVFFKRIL